MDIDPDPAPAPLALLRQLILTWVIGGVVSVIAFEPLAAGTVSVREVSLAGCTMVL